MVLLHEEHLRRFAHTLRLALAADRRPAYASLGALGRLVLNAAGEKLVWPCDVLTLSDPGIRSAPDATTTEISNEQLETPEYPSRWQTRYCIDSMLEHALMHPIR